MASCSLLQPLISAGVTSQSFRPKDVSSSHTSSVMVSSASFLEVEAASMCSSASVKTQASGHLVSQFWSTNSRRGLMARANTLDVSFRPGSSLVVEARLFGPAIFEAAKLKVLFLGADKKHPQELPRIYTLTHSDVTSKITLAISREINKAQLKGWYSKLQRDEVVAEWKKVQGKMTLHVHCHISGGNLMHNFIANLRFYIFRKELPVVLEAFRHGDEELLKEYPGESSLNIVKMTVEPGMARGPLKTRENGKPYVCWCIVADLDNSLVWVYFHSNVNEYNRLECWGPLVEAAKSTDEATEAIHHALEEIERKWPKELWPGKTCEGPCECCSRHGTLIPVPRTFELLEMQEEQRRST